MIRQQALKFGGGQHKIVCPECSPTRKKKNQRDMSLKIDDKIYYQCWHCGIQGAIEFEEWIVKLKPIKTERLDEETTGWLASRGISEKTAADLKLKSCRTFIPKLNTSTTCVAFPYIENNTPYAWKIRSIKEKGFICNGTPNTFFNLQNVKPQDDLIICEGEIDCLTFVETGFESVVSVPHGAVMKVSDGRIDARDDNKFKFLWNNRKKIENATRIIIATDSDNSGQAMMEEIARRIGKEK